MKGSEGTTARIPVLHVVVGSLEEDREPCRAGPKGYLRRIAILVVEGLTVVNAIHDLALYYISAHASTHASLSIQLTISMFAFTVLFAIKAPAQALSFLKFTLQLLKSPVHLFAWLTTAQTFEQNRTIT